MPFLVRRAEPADVPAVAEARIAAWRVAYRGLIPDAHLAALDVAADVERFAAAGPADTARRTIVACTAGTVVGFARCGPYRPQPNHGDVGAGTPALGARAVGELYALYVTPEHWGTGAGHALMTEALDGLARDRLAPVRLWVFTGNARARRFYERAGFHADGASALFEIGEDRVPEIRYTRP